MPRFSRPLKMHTCMTNVSGGRPFAVGPPRPSRGQHLRCKRPPKSGGAFCALLQKGGFKIPRFFSREKAQRRCALLPVDGSHASVRNTPLKWKKNSPSAKLGHVRLQLQEKPSTSQQGMAGGQRPIQRSVEDPKIIERETPLHRGGFSGSEPWGNNRLKIRRGISGTADTPIQTFDLELSSW